MLTFVPLFPVYLADCRSCFGCFLCIVFCSAVSSMASEDRNHRPVEAWIVEGTPQTLTVDRETMK